MAKLSPPIRPEYERDLPPLGELGVERSLSRWNRLWQHDASRKAVIIALLAIAWEAIARWHNNDMLLPSFTATAAAFFEGIVSGELIEKSALSLGVLLRGYVVGIFLALVITTLAISTRIGRDILSTLTSMLNPLPPIALLPISLLWFGLGQGSLIFVLVHSVLWPLALNTYSGFLGVPQTLRMTGRNYGLRGVRYIGLILIPAALPSILSGLKIGWAFAWRTLIAAELVFGASAGKGGLGWFIFQNRNELLTDRVFAGLLTVILIGLLVENFIFRALERVTVQRWGIQH